MGGTLVHSKQFRKHEYLAYDGQIHFELRRVDGDSHNASHTSWNEMKDLAERHGMPRDGWPEFMETGASIDVPLEQVEEKQAALRHHILKLPPEVICQHKWLGQVAQGILPHTLHLDLAVLQPDEENGAPPYPPAKVCHAHCLVPPHPAPRRRARLAWPQSAGAAAR